MEFVISKDMASALFSKAAGSIPNKDITPILKNFLISVKDGRIRVMATDMELGALADSALTGIIREGIAAAPANKLLEMISTAQDGNMVFRLEGSTLTVLSVFVPKSETKEEQFKTKWTVHCMDPETYPEFPVYEQTQEVLVECKKFVSGLDRISFAAAADELKVNLMAVYINENKMFAADGHRACRVTFQSDLKELLIPASAVKLIVKLLKGAGVDKVGVVKTQYHLLFKVGADIYHARQIEQTFPDVEKRVFVPTDAYGDLLAIEDREELKKAILRSRITSEDESRLLTFKIDQVPMDPKQLVPVYLQSRNNIDETCVESLSCLWSGNTAFERSVNWEYLQDVLNVLVDKKVLVRMGEEKGNVKTMYRIDEGDFSAIILPVRAKREKSEVDKEAAALESADKAKKKAKSKKAETIVANEPPPSAPSNSAAPPV